MVMLPDPSTYDQELLFWSLCDDLELSMQESADLLGGRMPKELTADELGGICARLIDRLPQEPGDVFEQITNKTPRPSPIVKSSGRQQYRIPVAIELPAISPDQAKAALHALMGGVRIGKIKVEVTGEPEAVNG